MFLIYLYLQGFMHPVDSTISAVSKRSRPKYADSYFLDIEHAMHMHMHIMQTLSIICICMHICRKYAQHRVLIYMNWLRCEHIAVFWSLQTSHGRRHPIFVDRLFFIHAWGLESRMIDFCQIGAPGNCSSPPPDRGRGQGWGGNGSPPLRIDSQRFSSLEGSRLSLGWLVGCKCRQRTWGRGRRRWRSCWCWGRGGRCCSLTRRSGEDQRWWNTFLAC